MFSADPGVGSVEVWRVLSRFAPPDGPLYPGRTSYLKVGCYRNPGHS